MEIHRGRLIDHVHLHAADLAKTQRFYVAVLEVLGIKPIVDEKHLNADELWIDGGPGFTNVHLAFQAHDRRCVDQFYKVGLAAGGRDNGSPGERSYHPGYYAAFLLDPDANNIEAVYHGPAERSVASVVIKFGGENS